ncbi:uncharacterized protein TRIVIDRAFT_112183, partial [Trichoderma virens Gv29-8]
KLPFVCPVRDCRVLSITMRALSSHFHGKHNRSLFNDNGDGTFSKVGDYVNEESSSPGIIVSCNLLSPGAPPPARPKTTPVPLPVQAATLMSSPLTVPSIPPPPPPPPIQSLEPPMTDVLRYLHRSLSPSQQVPTRIDIIALSKYKQVRNLPGVWWEHHHDKTLDPLQYACILAYLVGEAEEMNPCRRWKGLSRLSDPCVGLPRDLPAEARAAFSKSATCIACQYQFCCYRLKNECEWANNDGKQDLNGTTEGAVSQQNHQSVEESDKVVVLEDEDVDGGASTRRSNGLSTSTKQPEQYSVQSSEKKSPPLSTTALTTSIAGQKPSSAEVAEMEEMEDWEIAPGTMKDEKTNMNVGFSNAYMSNQHPITISPGLSFNVLIIKPGHTHHWPIEATKVRTCSVASGKISVKMGNDQAFKLGPNGLVVIRSGQSCMRGTAMALGGGPPIQRVTTGLALDVPVPSPTRTRSGRTRPPSTFTDTDETDLKPGDGGQFVEKQRAGQGGLRFTIDPEGRLTHDETSVDVVTVPCPAAHPLRSWNRDGLMGRYFGAPSMRDAEVHEAERQNPSWVRQGIRREANMARILLYEHPDISEGTTLNMLAIALLDELRALRTRERHQERPLLFIGHSIGGLVVKMALVKASRDTRYEGILRECYGVAFFGTPHQGSSYFAMPTLASSIQHLLQLSVPLPISLTDDLRMGNHLLLHVDEDFKVVSDDLRVWTFYETIDSRLSANSGNIYFTAPLTSIKSAILGMRQERIFPLQSDHANIASFGRHNVHTLRMFLRQLAENIEKADSNAREDARGGKWMLNLEQKVTVEVHGFFDEAGIEDGTVRAWSTRLPLREFMNKGPEACLSERLNEVEIPPEEGRFLAMRGRTGLVEMEGPPVTVSFPPDPVTVKNALGISHAELEHEHEHENPHPLLHQTSAPPAVLPVPPSPLILPVDSPRSRPRLSTESAPTAMVSQPGVGPLTPPSRPNSLPPRQSTPFRKPSPLMRASLDQELAIDRLSPPLRGRVGRNSFSRSMSLDSDIGGTSPPRYRDFPPFSQRSRSTFDRVLTGEENDTEDDELDASPKLPESVLAIRKMAKEKGHRASESAIVDDAPQTPFMKPMAKARKFVWIHLPFNNPTWVTVISPRGHSGPSRSLSPPGGDDQMYVCLFLPYLHFDSYKRLIRRRELIAKRLAHGRARPIPESVAKSDSLELQVVWEFLGHDPPINCRRTLDQFGYPSMRDTRSRDDDQMLYKLTKERYYDVAEYRGLYNQTSGSDLRSGDSSNKSGNGSGSGSGSGSRTSSWRERLSKEAEENGEEETEKDVLNGNVLMVDQLWLWTISTHTLLSFFPKRESDPIEGPLYQQADLRDSIFNDVNVDLTRLCDNSLDLAALAALHAVSVLLDRASHPDLEVFRIFEEAISVLTEKLTTSLKEFRSEGFRDKAFDYEPVENKARSIRERHKEEGRRAEQENRDNTSALLELRDIEDELATLLGLFERQSKVISSMHTIYNRPEMRPHTVHGRGFLAEALKRLAEYIHTTEEMVRRVKNTRDEYDKLLQMVQRQAQVDEVRLSRLHADLASAQSRSVLIFTTFTVIFLPLQFFTGVFGMNTREWGGGDNLTLKTIGVIAIPASVALIVGTLIVAWSTTARRFFKWIGRRYGRMMRWLYVIFGRPVTRKVMIFIAKRGKRRQRQGDDRDGNGGLSTETSDFWERHRLERERGYQIPEVNK